MSKPLTPMMQQYMDLKAQYPDCILLFRLGDFYEMFFEDAITASKALEITLTGRDCGQEERAPMCGVPHHAAENYITRLIEQGYKVAIGEQVEDPREVKGIVKREVVRVVTPGTVLNDQSLIADRNNYLMVIYRNIAHIGISYVDITTGDFYTTQLKGMHKVLDEIAKVQPKEIIINSHLNEDPSFMTQLTNRFDCFVSAKEDWYFDKDRCLAHLLKQFKVMSLDGLGLVDAQEAMVASGSLIAYLFETQKGQLAHLTHCHYYRTDDFMHLDMGTRRNLELVETLREKQRRGSLLWVLDKTQTAMGARMLRHMLEEPLTNTEAIIERLDAVEELKNTPILRAEISEYLSPVYDIERLMGKISCKTANCRDLLSFRQSISMITPIKTLLADVSSQLLKTIGYDLDPLEDLVDLIEASIHEEAPISLKDGQLIKEGYDKQVDEYRRASSEGKQWLASLEAREREATGIKAMKIKYNKVFGYYFEVTNSYLGMVPERFTRKQTMSNGERYITPELKEMEDKILGAQEKVIALEYDLFVMIRETIAKEVDRIKTSAVLLASLDAYQSLAEVADKNHYCRPELIDQGSIKIVDGRHPVVEKMMGLDGFIPNDTYLDLEEHRFSIITGPNMAGKSTYMRQVALIALMTQIGSFVPAKSACLGVCDRIFTRVGASDDLASGQSTFMVEMTEVANILRYATRHSLVILDEIGRGTSTFDGLSLAWAIVEYIVNYKSIGAKSLFATHYHELTELEGKIDGVQNYCIAVKENRDDLIFLRKIIPGGADKSYGIQVAKLAGVPTVVIERAKIILEELTEADITQRRGNIDVMKLQEKHEPLQMNLFAMEHPVIAKLKEVNLNHLTPIEALNLLAQFKSMTD